MDFSEPPTKETLEGARRRLVVDGRGGRPTAQIVQEEAKYGHQRYYRPSAWSCRNRWQRALGVPQSQVRRLASGSGLSRDIYADGF